jgi:hypothetical protein
MMVADPIRSPILVVRLMSDPCLWSWEIREVDGALVESGWISTWEAYDSREAAEAAGRRRLNELVAGDRLAPDARRPAARIIPARSTLDRAS